MVQSVIRKPSIDDRDYRHLVLQNGLEAVLVSDAQTRTAAASVAVSVGQLDDPPELAGMAHFLEHMLFLGTERYPKDDDFDAFCASCAGSSNAWTGLEHTCFHFAVAADRLQSALDRFGAFFTCPLFTQSCTDREKAAIESEHLKSLSSDHAREYQLLRSTANAQHAFSKFGSGNLKTLHELPQALGIDLHSELLKFHKQRYSAGKMRLAVVGAEPLDTLEEWVRSLFEPVAAAAAEVTAASDEPPPPPLGSEWTRLYRIIPHQQLFKIGMYFPMPSTNRDYLQKPYRLLSHCIGHEGAGSILAALKARGWAAELAAGPGSNQYNEFAIFQVSIRVTEDGLRNWDKVVRMVFEYIELIREADDGTRNRIRDEVAAVEECNFRFKTRIEEERFVEQLACNQLRYPAALALCGPDLLFEPLDADGLAKVKHYLDDVLTPRNMRLHLIAPRDSQPAATDVEWLTEQWYETEYAACGIGEDSLAAWSDMRRRDFGGELWLPAPNPYVTAPSELGLVSPTKLPSGAARLPALIVDTQRLKCWHLNDLDATMQMPKVAIQIQLTSAVADTSVRNAVLLRLMLEALQIAMNEDRYNASEAGLDLEMVNTHHLSPVVGLRFISCGYSASIPLLLRALFKCLATLRITDEQFRTVHETTINDYRNRLFAQPFMHAMQSVMKLVELPCYTNEDRLEALPSLTARDLNDFCDEFRTSGLKLEAVVVGNISDAAARALMQELLDELQPAVLAAVPRGRMVVLDGACEYRADASLFHPHDENGVAWYVQFGVRSTRTSMKAELLTQFLDRAMYAQLRTVEQLGYVVGTSPWQRWGTTGMFCIVQSSQSADEVTERMRSFFRDFGAQTLGAMGGEQFQEAVAGLVSKKRQTDRNIHDMCERWMHEVATAELVFDRPEQDVAELESITLPELTEFFESHFLAGGTVISHSHRQAAPDLAAGRPKDVARTDVRTAAHEVISIAQFQERVR